MNSSCLALHGHSAASPQSVELASDPLLVLSLETLKAVSWAQGRAHLVCFSSLTDWFPVSWKLIFYAFYLFLFFGRGDGQGRRVGWVFRQKGQSYFCHSTFTRSWRHLFMCSQFDFWRRCTILIDQCICPTLWEILFLYIFSSTTSFLYIYLTLL